MSNRVPYIILEKIDISALLAAQKTFNEALLRVNEGVLERDGVIQRFECTFELAWKTMKRVLHFKGSQTHLPRDVIREAASNGLVTDPVIWFDFLEKKQSESYL